MIETDTAGVIQRWNDGAEELFGHPAAVALGRKVDFIVPGHLRDAHWTGFHRAMNEPKIKDLAADLPVLCADGEVRHFAGRLLVLSALSPRPAEARAMTKPASPRRSGDCSAEADEFVTCAGSSSA